MKKLFITFLILLFPAFVWAGGVCMMGGGVESGGAGGLAFDASSGGHGEVSTDTVTFSHTCTGDNRVLVVGVRAPNSEPTGITYNSVALTSLWSGNESNNAWYLVAPAVGPHDIIITFATAQIGIVSCASSYTGVHQTIPFDAPGTLQSGYTTSLDVDVSSAIGDWVIDFLHNGVAGTTPGAGQTVRAAHDHQSTYVTMSTKDGTSTCNMSWSWTSGGWGYLNGVSINPVP